MPLVTPQSAKVVSPFYVRHRWKLLLVAGILGALLLTFLFAFTWYLSPMVIPAAIVLVKTLGIAGAFSVSAVIGCLGLGGLTWMVINVLEKLEGLRPMHKLGLQMLSPLSTKYLVRQKVVEYFKGMSTKWGNAVSKALFNRLRGYWQQGWGVGALSKYVRRLSRIASDTWWYQQIRKAWVKPEHVIPKAKVNLTGFVPFPIKTQTRGTIQQVLSSFPKEEYDMKRESYILKTTSDFFQLIADSSPSDTIKKLILNFSLNDSVSRLMPFILMRFQIEELEFQGNAKSGALSILQNISSENVLLKLYSGVMNLPLETNERISNLCMRNIRYSVLMREGRELYAKGIDGNNFERGYAVLEALKQFCQQYESVLTIKTSITNLIQKIEKCYSFFRTKTQKNEARVEQDPSRSSTKQTQSFETTIVVHPNRDNLSSILSSSEAPLPQSAAPSFPVLQEAEDTKEARINAFLNEQWYAVLGAKAGDSLPEIKNARDRLLKKWHPDKGLDPIGEQATLINLAYEYILDPKKAPKRPESSLGGLWTKEEFYKAWNIVINNDQIINQLLHQRREQCARDQKLVREGEQALNMQKQVNNKTDTVIAQCNELIEKTEEVKEEMYKIIDKQNKLITQNEAEIKEKEDEVRNLKELIKNQDEYITFANQFISTARTKLENFEDMLNSRDRQIADLAKQVRKSNDDELSETSSISDELDTEHYETSDSENELVSSEKDIACYINKDPENCSLPLNNGFPPVVLAANKFQVCL